MAGVDGVGGASPATPTRRTPGRATGDFSLTAEPQARPNATAGGPSAVAMETLLALQAVDDAPERDRAARRHGGAMLAGLAGLQRALLGHGGNPRAVLTELEELAASVPAATDPALAGVLAAIRLRVRVELARHGG